MRPEHLTPDRRPDLDWADGRDHRLRSLNQNIDLTILRGRAKVIAIKQNVDICPWADMVYGCDAAWWRFRRGLPEFKGLKLCWAGNGSALPNILISPRGYRARYSRKNTAMICSSQPGIVGGGGNSGFQALNLAAQFGATRIILIGFDMTDRGGKHWYGRNHWPMSNNPDDSNFRRWIAAFDKAAPVLAALGIQVFNASPNSALRCFPFADLETALGTSGDGLARLRSA
jgi:hypothetical protein